METQFNTGTYDLHEEPNMNYQLNRVYSVFGGDIDEIRAVSTKIATLDHWKREFLKLAERALGECRYRHAAAYYRGIRFQAGARAEAARVFTMPPEDITYPDLLVFQDLLYSHIFEKCVAHRIPVHPL